MGPIDPGQHARRAPHPGNAPPRSAIRRPSARTVLRKRLRAARELGVPAPALSLSSSSSPRGRLAALDRRIARALDLAGGTRLPPWDDQEEEDDDEDLWTPSFRRS